MIQAIKNTVLYKSEPQYRACVSVHSQTLSNVSIVIICGYCANPQIKYIHVNMYSDYLIAVLFDWDGGWSLYL